MKLGSFDNLVNVSRGGIMNEKNKKTEEEINEVIETETDSHTFEEAVEIQPGVKAVGFSHNTESFSPLVDVALKKEEKEKIEYAKLDTGKMVFIYNRELHDEEDAKNPKAAIVLLCSKINVVLQEKQLEKAKEQVLELEKKLKNKK